MNKDTDLTLFNGRYTIDNGVKGGATGINECINLPDGGLQWRSVCYLEGKTPFNIIWERAVDPTDFNSRVILESVAHFPSPIFISVCER